MGMYLLPRIATRGAWCLLSEGTNFVFVSGQSLLTAGGLGGGIPQRLHKAWPCFEEPGSVAVHGLVSPELGVLVHGA